MLEKHDVIHNRINNIFDREDRIFAASTEINIQEKNYEKLSNKIGRIKNAKLKAKYEEELDSLQTLLEELTAIQEEEEGEQPERDKKSKYEKIQIEELTGKVKFEEEVKPGKVDLAPDWSVEEKEPEPKKNLVTVQQRVTITPPPDQGERITKTKTIKIPVKGKNLTAVINTIEKGIEKVFSFFKKLF